MKYFACVLPVLLPVLAPEDARAAKLLPQKPTLSKTHVVFAFAGDLWIVPREGGAARRLTVGPGRKTDPHFSPDGKLVAYTGTQDGNTDIYVIAAGGGTPRRLTFHPSEDRAAGWTPDGKRVLFRSGRHDPVGQFASGRLFTVAAEGGFPDELPLSKADHGCYSPDGKSLAYVPHKIPEWMAWKRYRGGTAAPVWIAQLSDSSITKVPRTDSNDFNPMWVGDSVYFLSDRDGPVTLFAYDTQKKTIRKMLENHGLDFKAASAGPGAIVYEQFGSLHLFDLKSEKSRPLDVTVEADLPARRPRFVSVAKEVRNVGVSPTGARAVFEARGEIFTVPAKKGHVRNLTGSPAVADRDPSWSPDGKRIAYFSDESGEYQLRVRDQGGLSEVKKYGLARSPSFYYNPVWSPDGKKIAYHDKRLNLWYIDLGTGESTLVDTSTYETRVRTLDPTWAPDSNWLTYTKRLKNHLHAVFVYSLKAGKAHRVSDGMSDARYATFDKGGKYLYFTASTDYGPTKGWIDMSRLNRPVTRSVYVVVLAKDQPSPLPLESDEEKDAAAEKEKAPAKTGGKKAERPAAVRIDLKDIDQRVLALPVPARDYQGLHIGAAGVVFLVEQPPYAQPVPPAGGLVVHKFELDKRKDDKFIDGVSRAVVSHDGGKLLYQKADNWFLVGTATPPKAGDGALKLDSMELRVDPRAEWKQMYREVWRIQRDFVYDPGLHGLDVRAAEKRYESFIECVGSRSDLNYLFREMLGELSLGHTYVQGGDVPRGREVKVGLLGADYRVENGRYRFARIYHGENWNPSLKAPLTQPGVNVRSGEYLLAVNGKEVVPSENLYKFFEGIAGKAVVLRVGPGADGKGARDVTVVPNEFEFGLRYRAWVEDNRRKVARLSKGRVGYVHLPNTAVEGYTSFNRYFFAQNDKQGVVLDERFNGGGWAADHVIDYLRRQLMYYWTTREGEVFTGPVSGIFGPKAMITNEMAGSGGDLLPWMFRRAKLGPLVGTRTWGGLVGIYDYPVLLDGGTVTAPRLAFWTPESKWEVENRGVAPDIEVEQDPKLIRAGRDPQLERAVQVVLEEIEKNPLRTPKRPDYPNYHKGKPLSPEETARRNERLWEAARNGDVKAVEHLLAEGADVNARTRYGATALWFASYKNRQPVIDVLLKHRADVNVVDNVWGMTPLAMAGTKADLIKRLLRAGARGGDGVFLNAARQGNAAVMQAILDAQKVKPDTLTAALVLAPAKSAKVQELLKKAGAKPVPGPASEQERKSLEACVGSYESPNGFTLQVTRKEGILVVGFASFPLYLLKPGGKDTYTALANDGVTFTFPTKGDKVVRMVMKLGASESLFDRAAGGKKKAEETRLDPVKDEPIKVAVPRNWPSFRGLNASGVGDGQYPPTAWEVKKPHKNQWKTPIPGLGHSCPVVWGDRVFLTTAVSSDPKSKLKAGAYGSVEPAADVSKHTWRVYCLDKRSGKILWDKIAYEGMPKTKRHPKGSQANATPATDGKHLVVWFASEGLYCYDFDGKLLWKRDLGVQDSGFFSDPDMQWGASSSPVLYKGLVILQCDRQKDSFLAAFRVTDGKPVWRTPRDESPSWGTPTIYEGKTGAELITAATNYTRGYDPLTGKELWRLGRHSEITVPTPITGQGLIFVTNGYRPVQPIYAIWPGARGDISLKDRQESSEQVAWSKVRGGPYMPTPIVYGDHLYVCSNNGNVVCYEARTGKMVYQKRLGSSESYTASPVAADGRIYFTSEEGKVRVVKAGPEFRLLAVNDMGDTCLATPAIADGMIFVRSEHFLFGIGRPEGEKKEEAAR
jgi:tricorn protease